ncbi:antibiotic biosynthesis monooxygenase [Caballeronia calidae]|uniref:Antibiotic biosynthesis monooxygenase n=1 Tax=Caballeronia calidae TaxID=1777139 RepID=A0A158DUR4_9BURK|nr:antibiotic biosynthesis monooxygenase [Caballeronia calidae]SAK98335.1 antibiotic biosynthesis monooxygenase [Caballeronia calidae]
MVIELADIRIHADQKEHFEKTISYALQNILSKSTGFVNYEISHSIESPERYVLRVCWETVEHHTTGFRQSANYQEWQKLVSPFFAQRPIVEHFEIVVR